MAWRYPPDRVKTTTTSTGTGSLTLSTSAAFGMRSFQDTINEGEQSSYVVAMTSDEEVVWEEFNGTRTGNVLSRDTVITNYLNNTDKVNFGAGTKEVFATASGSQIAFLSAANVWASDQTFRGKVIIGPTDLTYWTGAFASSVHSATFTLGGATHTVKTVGGQDITQASDTTDYGPVLSLTRTRTNATTGSEGPRWDFRESDGSSNVQVLGSIAAFWRNLTSSGNGSINHQVRVAGSATTYLTLSGGVGVQIRNAPLLVGKTVAGDLQTAGAEIKQSGEVTVTASAAIPLTINRLVDDGHLVDFYRGSDLQGWISVAGTTVTYQAFHGAHPSCFPDDMSIPDHIEPGTVMITDDDVFPAQPHLPRARISTDREDTRVYGVFLGWTQPDGHEESGEAIWKDPRRQDSFDISALGVPPFGVRCVGPVKAGDLLITSETHGCAEAWKARRGRQYRQWPDPAAVLGRVLRSDPDDGIRLVCASLQAG